MNYPEGQRFTWSRPTVFRCLARLKQSGIATTGGLSHYHGTRRRELHSERLLFVPLESETPTRRESETGSKAFRKFHVSRKKRTDTHTAAKSAVRGVEFSPSKKKEVSLPYETAAELRRPARAAELLNQMTLWKLCGSPEVMLAWVLRPTKRDPHCQRKIFHPLEYVSGCITNFLRAYPDYQQDAIIERFEGLPGLYFDGQHWHAGSARQALEARIEANRVEPKEEDRIKIDFIHAVVEEAGRRGVLASEVLAERLGSNSHGSESG